jgi:heme oxygenase
MTTSALLHGSTEGGERASTMARLKADTAPHHERAERALLALMPMDRPDIVSYTNALVRMATWYRPMEASVERISVPLAAVGLSVSERRKMPLLDADLVALGVGARVGETALVPLLETLPRALGCLYVLEGATLGGQIVVRQLAAPLGLTASCGASFFASYGPRVGAMWRGFGEVVEEVVVGGEGESGKCDAVVEAAQEVFDSLSVWLEGGVLIAGDPDGSL